MSVADYLLGHPPQRIGDVRIETVGIHDLENLLGDEKVLSQSLGRSEWPQ